MDTWQLTTRPPHKAKERDDDDDDDDSEKGPERERERANGLGTFEPPGTFTLQVINGAGKGDNESG